MAETLRTRRYTIDRASYLRMIWARGLAPRLAIVAALYAAVLLILGLAWGAPALIGAVPGCVALLLFAIALRYFFTRRAVYGKSGAKAYDDGRTMEFSEEGVHVVTEGGVDSSVPWTQYEKAERRGAFTLVFLNNVQHFIVPDDAFATTSERETFWALLREKGLLKPT